jgi:hypothetical protein
LSAFPAGRTLNPILHLKQKLTLTSVSAPTPLWIILICFSVDNLENESDNASTEPSTSP